MKQTINSPIRKLRLLLVLPLMAGVFYAFATPEYKFVEKENSVSNLTQSEKIVKGKVTSENGNSLKSASVIISGKPIGTITDENGNFMLKVTDDSPIVVSYVGFQTVKINPDFEKEMQITMQKATISIKFDNQTSEARQKEQIDVNKSNALVIVDGKEITKAEMEKINPDKIASIDVLKDKASSEKYGEKGKDGVILIKTKNASPTMEISAKQMEMKDRESITLKEPQKINLKNVTGQQPFLVIDGTISENKKLEDIDLNTVESMNVLKGETATKKYGEKAQEGAIEITLKASAKNQVNSAFNIPTANSNQPLYFLDGKEIEYQKLSGISPDNIESISVLKNESATSTYGERAKNGVVLIVSKKNNPNNGEVTVVGYGTNPNNQLKSGVQLRTTGGNEPLIVKDGVVSPNLKMDDINPSDIESINVLKSEPAMAKYGEKGKNGVLEMTMKKQGDVFTMVEEMPQFPGGNDALKSFVYSTLKYPVIALENGIYGEVFVKFVVSKTGKVTDAKIARGVDPSLDKEAVRIVESMPKWSPGKQNGEAVDVNYTIPVNFKLPANRPSNVKLTKITTTKTTYTKQKNNQKDATHQLIIVPNPTKDKATLTLKGAVENKKLEVSVFDNQGKLMKKESKKGPSFSLSFANLVSGTYLVIVQDGDNQYSGQIVVTH